MRITRHTQDPLTGLDNRRTYRAALGALLETNLPVSLVMFDIDKFRAINERLGFAEADQILVELASLLAGELAPHRVARFGGEEFVVVLAGDHAAATAIAERTRAAVERTGITVSAGVVTSQPFTTTGDLEMVAIERIAVAKRTGRNRVVSA